MSPEMSSLLIGFGIGFLLALTIAAFQVHALVKKHRAILAAHGIPSRGKRDSQVVPPTRR